MMGAVECYLLDFFFSSSSPIYHHLILGLKYI